MPLLRQALHDKAEARAELLRSRAETPAKVEPLEPRVAYVRHELKPERLQPKIDRVQESLAAAAAAQVPEPAPEAPRPAEATAPEPAPEPKAEVKAASERRRERRLERQESSEQETPRHDAKAGG